MKIQLTKIFAPLLVALIAASFVAFPAAYAEQTTTQDKAMDIIENVLSVDLSKYIISLKHDSTLDGVPLANETRTINTLLYTLSSENSTLDVNFIVEKGIVVQCNILPMYEQVITDKQYTNLLDAVKGFLERYQTQTKIDSTNLIAMLDNVDITKDSITTVGNTKLAISANSFWPGTDQTTFKWIQTSNGADYTSLQVSFHKNGAIASIIDTRALYTIGDTSINISKEQAIDIALKNLSSYSYEMPDGSIVKDFNVAKDKVLAQLATSPVNYELRPYWDIRMPLNQTYPGSVQGITAFIWANTGEIISYSNVAIGGVDGADNGDTSDAELTTTSPSPSSPKTNEASIDLGMVGIIAVVAVAIAAIATTVIVKKRSK